MVLDRYQLPAGDAFGMHRHVHHQLAWTAEGVLNVLTPQATRVLPPTQAMWIPGGVEHDTVATRDCDLYCVYAMPQRCSIDWAEPTVVVVTPLVRELIVHIATGGSQPLAEQLLFEQLRPLSARSYEVPMPADPRAFDVATRLVADPGDDRSLADWGREVGASSRTLARHFVAGTGLTFTDWRIRARLHASLEPLAAGEPVSNVAARVGYASISAFVAAFRREFGRTPGRFFAA